MYPHCFYTYKFFFGNFFLAESLGQQGENFLFSFG